MATPSRHAWPRARCCWTCTAGANVRGRRRARPYFTHRPTAAKTGDRSPRPPGARSPACFSLTTRLRWAVGHQSVILKSGDGGETWAKANAENDPETAYLDILFLDAKTGFIVGSYGKFLSTSDGGKTWTEAKQDDDPHFSHIIPAPDGGLWLTGEFGTVRRSGDRARRWEPLATPYEGTFFGALPLAKGGAVVFGLRGNIFRSEDGKAWKQVESQRSRYYTAAWPWPMAGSCSPPPPVNCWSAPTRGARSAWPPGRALHQPRRRACGRRAMAACCWRATRACIGSSWPI